MLEALISVFRPLQSSALKVRAFTFTRMKVGRSLPACGALRSHFPSAVHSLTAVTAHTMGAEPSYLPAAAAGNVRPRHAATTHRPAA